MAIKPADQKQSAQFKAGEAAFKSIGCAVRHMPKLGEVDGIYSDLLLHDMGPQLADADAYTVFAGDQLEAKDLAIAGRVRATESPASFREWRTPPLWGMGDSAPYMHDDETPPFPRRSRCMPAKVRRRRGAIQSYLSDGSNKSRRF